MSSQQKNAMDLQRATQHFRLLADATRLRLLLLLDREELSVAELAAITQLAQPRVSTHLAKLKEAGLVADRRDGVFVYYRIATATSDPSLDELWQLLRRNSDDPLIQQDLERIAQILDKRSGSGTWADSVAGDMERHYSPGRTWEATARGLVHLLDLGDVLDVASGDGALAALVAQRARSVTGLDASDKVVAAARKRLASLEHVRFVQGDMHKLPFEPASFDAVLLMNCLTYAKDPAQVVCEAGRVLRLDGRVVGVTLAPHQHASSVTPFGHINQGVCPNALHDWLVGAGFSVDLCEVTSREKRPPHFNVITFHAQRA